MGRNNLFKFLRDIKLLADNNEPYQRYVAQNIFAVGIVKWYHPNTGELQVTTKTLVTPFGIKYIRSKLDENGFTPESSALIKGPK